MLAACKYDVLTSVITRPFYDLLQPCPYLIRYQILSYLFEYPHMAHTQSPCNLYLLSFHSWYSHVDHDELLPLAYNWMPPPYRLDTIQYSLHLIAKPQQGIHTPVDTFNHLDASIMVS